MWCCEAFETGLIRRGDKGMSIIPRRENGYDGFFLEARPFEKDVVEKYAGLQKEGLPCWPELRDSRGRTVPYTLSISMLLVYCPWCGTRLDKCIKKYPKEFERLLAMPEVTNAVNTATD
jgi:hypothetical protein